MLAGKVSRIAADLANTVTRPGVIPVRYYRDAPNVGDMLNEFLIPAVSGREIVSLRTRGFTHLVPIGSLLGLVNHRSVVWGAGSIDGAAPADGFSKRNIYALRGHETRRVLEQACGESINVPLGDPALLMPRFHEPEFSREFEFGVVPHHSEPDILDFILERRLDGIHAIDVTLPPRQFVGELARCGTILSSSLHGLILSDSYEIKNLWVSFSGRLKGGFWKFLDYYSTTDAHDPAPAVVGSLEGFSGEISNIAPRARVNRAASDPGLVLDAFPAQRFGL